MIGMQTVAPFPFSLQSFGIYSLIPLLYIIGKDAIGLYYLSRPNVKSYFGQVKKQTGDELMSRTIAFIVYPVLLMMPLCQMALIGIFAEIP